jgi:flagellar basal body-associated protein FliL
MERFGRIIVTIVIVIIIIVIIIIVFVGMFMFMTHSATKASKPALFVTPTHIAV